LVVRRLHREPYEDGIRFADVGREIDVDLCARFGAEMTVKPDQLKSEGLELAELSVQAPRRLRQGGAKGKDVFDADCAIDKQLAIRLAPVVTAKLPFDEERPIHVVRKLDVVHNNPDNVLSLRHHRCMLFYLGVSKSANVRCPLRFL
jgi:hypothetical protein